LVVSETGEGIETAIELQTMIGEIVHPTRHDLRLFLGEMETEGGSEVPAETEVHRVELHMSVPAERTLIVVGEIALGLP